MIKKATDINCLSGVSSPLLPLIYANFSIINASSNGVYCQFNNENQIVFILSVKNSQAVATATGAYDAEEIQYFLKMMGVTSVISDSRFDNLGISFKQYELLKLCEEKRCDNNCTQFLGLDSKAEDYRGVFSLFSCDEELFASWYVEVCKKIIYPCGLFGYIKSDNQIVSAALATGIYENKAVISGVFTHEKYRNKGFGSECVAGVSSKLASMGVTDVFLWCEEDKLDFYYKLGYKKFSYVFVGACK